MSPCHVGKVGDATVILCTRGRRRSRKCCVPGCPRDADRLCDADIGQRTCDAPICTQHAKRIGPDRDLCPKHAEINP